MADVTLLGGTLQATEYSSGGELVYFYDAEVSNPAMARNAVETGQLPDCRCEEGD